MYQALTPIYLTGKITTVNSSILQAELPVVTTGLKCHIATTLGDIQAEIISGKDHTAFLAPLNKAASISVGDKVFVPINCKNFINIPKIGSVVDGEGNLLLGESCCHTLSKGNLSTGNSVSSLSRPPINKKLHTKIRSIDTLLPLGYGQRIGLFAPAGAGKSTLLGDLAKTADVDITVLALIGERGREVREFIEDILGPDEIKKSIVVVATSDEPAAKRRAAANYATSIAEHYRDQGKRVLLMMDSLTRFARAVRDLAISCGEIPVRQGYPSAVYTELPVLLERAGNTETGSITAIYTVLYSGSSDADQLSEEIKSLLDGHIYLSPKIAEVGIRPAVDILRSVSRVNTKVSSNTELQQQTILRKALARLERDKDIVMLGGKADAELERFLLYEGELVKFLNQSESCMDVDKLSGMLTAFESCQRN